MKNQWISARLAATSVLVGAVAMIATQANAQDRVRWKMQSAFGSSLVHLGPSGLRFAERVKQMSGGAFDIRFQEPGALVPALEAFDSVSKGAIESAWTTPGYHTGKLGGAISFFTAVPFGPQLGEFLAWKWFGGGQDLREEMYNAHGATAVDSFCIGPETSGWFKEEITSMEQIKGLKMRFFGLGAEVLPKMGISTQLLSGEGLFSGLGLDSLDATELLMPTIDIQLGFYQIAKNNYYPGWHQQVSCSEFLMNKEMHDALPDAYKAMIQAAALEQVVYAYAETEAKNPAAMMEMLEMYGVTNRRWPDDTLKQLEAAWIEVVAEESAADPMFARIAESFYAFREVYRVWGEAQALAITPPPGPPPPPPPPPCPPCPGPPPPPPCPLPCPGPDPVPNPIPDASQYRSDPPWSPWPTKPLPF